MGEASLWLRFVNCDTLKFILPTLEILFALHHVAQSIHFKHAIKIVSKRTNVFEIWTASNTRKCRASFKHLSLPFYNPTRDFRVR